MAFTTGNDENILQSTDTTNVGAGAGNDTYILAANKLTAGQKITITDTEGTNKLQLIGGLTIASSKVTADVAELTLSNGAVVTILGASTFSYEVGGNSLTGVAGATKTFAQFVTTTLGHASVPTGSTVSSATNSVAVNENGTVTTGGTAGTYSLTASAPTVVEGNTGSTTLSYTITLNKAATEAVTVDYATQTTGTATAGTDFTAATGSVTFAVGETSKTVTVTVTGDTAVEADETVVVKFSGAKLTADVTATGTITNDDVAPSFLLTSGVDKGAAFTGTAANENYSAPILTLNAGDELDGAGGTDTLTAEINSAVGATTKIANIEEITFSNLGAQTVDFTNITGVTKLTQKDGTGKLTLNNIATANMGLALQGTATASIEANYKAGTLSGAADALTVDLNGALNAAVDVDAGFESLTLNVNNASSLTTLTVPGVTGVTVNGSANLTLNANPATAFETVNAAGMTGAIKGKTIDATTGLSTEGFTGSANGTTLLLGTGADNVSFTDATAATKSNTIKLGAGNDTLTFTTAGAGGNYVFGEAGDDLVQADGLSANDLVDLGVGTDTLRVAGTNADVVLRGVENLTVNKAATIAINSADTALAVTAKADNSAVSVTGLSANSTVSVVKDVAAAAAATTVTVGYAATQAAATLDIQTGMTGKLTTTKITAVTANLGAASDIGTQYDITDATSFTLNATGALSATTGQNITDATGTDTLKTVTVTGTDLVKVGTVTSTVLETVSVTAAKDLTYGAIGGDSTKLTTVNLTATAGAIAGNAAIGLNTNTNVLSVTATAKDAIDLAAIISTKIGNISATSTNATKTIDVGAIGADATEFGNITLSADGAITVGQVGNATEVATAFGTFTANSTNGKVQLNATAINTKDAGGIDVALTAKTTIDSDGAGTATAIENVGGNITASIAGTAAAAVNFITTTSGLVNLTATNTGGLTSTITNAGAVGGGTTSTINLGNAIAGKSNAITLKGAVDTIVVNGGTGDDTISFTNNDNEFKVGTISLGTGNNKVDFTNVKTLSTTTDGSTDNGIAINLGSSTLTFDSAQTYTTSVASGKAVAYDATGDENNATSTSTKVVSGGFSYSLSGVTEVVGTGKADYIVANSTGTKITGGAGADTLILGAGVDTVITGSLAADADTISNFTKGSDKLDLSAPLTAATLTIGTQVAFDTTAKATTIAAITTAAGTDAEVYYIKNTKGHAQVLTLAEIETAIEQGTAATGQATILIDDGTDTMVYFDAAAQTDASGGAGLILVATLIGVTGATALATGDLISV